MNYKVLAIFALSWGCGKVEVHENGLPSYCF